MYTCNSWLPQPWPPKSYVQLVKSMLSRRIRPDQTRVFQGNSWPPRSPLGRGQNAVVVANGANGLLEPLGEHTPFRPCEHHAELFVFLLEVVHHDFHVDRRRGGAGRKTMDPAAAMKSSPRWRSGTSFRSAPSRPGWWKRPAPGENERRCSLRSHLRRCPRGSAPQARPQVHCLGRRPNKTG